MSEEDDTKCCRMTFKVRTALEMFKNHLSTELWKRLEAPLISLYFASKESDLFVVFKVVLSKSSPDFLTVFQGFTVCERSFLKDLFFHLIWSLV